MKANAAAPTTGHYPQPSFNDTTTDRSEASRLPANANTDTLTSAPAKASLQAIKPVNGSGGQVLTLKPATAQRLQSLLANFGAPYFSGTFSDPSQKQAYQDFLASFGEKESAASEIVAQVLAEDESEIFTALQQLKQNKSDLTHVMIKGCPLTPEQEVSTPLPYGTTDLSSKSPAPEWLLIGVANLLGKPMGYTNEKNAQIIHQIAPDPEKMKSLSSAGSKCDLPPHIEAAALFVRPDFLILGCARGDREKQAQTSVYPVDNAVSHLSDIDVETLQQERFTHGMPPSFGNYSESEVQESRPPQTVLTRTQSGHFEANIDVAFTTPYNANADQEARAALEHLNEGFKAEKLPFKLESGDLLLFSNTRSLHGRNGFNCFGDGQDRWLQRVYVASDLDTKVSMREGSSVGGRIFDNGDVKIL